MIIETFSEQINFNTFIISAIAGLAGWVMRDLRVRMTSLEKKTEAMVTGMFYLILKDPEAPDEAKRAVEAAMRGYK